MNLKLNRTYLFITTSSLALLLVLIIQVNWIFETARVKEELFNDRANMVLARTTEALSSDTAIRKNMETCIGNNEVNKIDSLFKHYMKFYNFHINYYFEVKQKRAADQVESAWSNNNYLMEQGCYKKSLDELSGQKGFELKLIFPEKKQFIIAEMGTMFITSVILILVVLVMFWRTIRSLLKKEKILEYTTDFLNNMTHEFKTPLTNIALASKMIIKDSNIKQEDKIKHYSGIILQENEKLTLQVEQVLSMAALEGGEIPLQKAEIDFHELIHDCLKSSSLQIEHKKGNLKLDLDAPEFMVLGDKTELANALCNLIDNAVKYAEEKLYLSIRTFNSGQNLTVEISDQGIGIEKEYQKKVFDKFFRVPTGDIHDVKGFGLGLAYVKKIIELHGGTIELRSEKVKGFSGEASAQGGTTFTITLPHV